MSYTKEDFTVVICAYGECEYLEESIKSVVNQTCLPKILISTSTPNDYIKKLSDKYGIEMRVNYDGGHVKDYNFALSQPDTAVVMLAHQDDLLDPKFVDMNLKKLNASKRPIISFCNYLEIHNNCIDRKASLMVKIKRLMLIPMKWCSGTGRGKRIIQFWGNPITHPTVVCVMKEMPKKVFDEKYKATMDWDLWERLSRQKGSFVYIDEVLLFHRMNEDNQTTKFIGTCNVRSVEEYEIFCRMWPKWIAKLIMKVYSKAEKFY